MRMSGQVLAASASLSSVVKLALSSSALASSKTIRPLVTRPSSLSSQALARRSAALAVCDGAAAGGEAAAVGGAAADAAAAGSGVATGGSVFFSVGTAAIVSLAGGVASAPLGGRGTAGAGGSGAGAGGGGG